MKALALSLLFAALVIQAADYTPSRSDFRIHNGTLYNVTLSSKWSKLFCNRDSEQHVILAAMTKGVIAQEDI